MLAHAARARGTERAVALRLAYAVREHPAVLEAWMLGLDHAPPMIGKHGCQFGREGHHAALPCLRGVPNRTAHV